MRGSRTRLWLVLLFSPLFLPLVTPPYHHSIEALPSRRFLPIRRLMISDRSREPYLPIDKVSRHVSSLHDGVSDGKPLIVLALSGALCPVHRCHVDALHCAKRWIEGERLGIVVGGYLAPSSDSYVRGKNGPQAMSLSRRVDCCKLATNKSEFVHVLDWGWGSASTIVSSLRRRLSESFPLASPIQVWLVAGADHAYRHRLYAYADSFMPTIAIGRKGDSAKLRDALRKDGVCASKFFHLCPTELPGVSSTGIRAALASGDWDVASSHLHPDVLAYLRRAEAIFD